MFETDEVSGCSKLNAKFFFLVIPDPTIAPSPEANGIVYQFCGALKPPFAFEKCFCLVVEIEDGTVPIWLDIESPLVQK